MGHYDREGATRDVDDDLFGGLELVETLDLGLAGLFLLLLGGGVRRGVVAFGGRHRVIIL